MASLVQNSTESQSSSSFSFFLSFFFFLRPAVQGHMEEHTHRLFVFPSRVFHAYYDFMMDFARFSFMFQEVLINFSGLYRMRKHVIFHKILKNCLIKNCKLHQHPCFFFVFFFNLREIAHHLHPVACTIFNVKGKEGVVLHPRGNKSPRIPWELTRKKS